jgi:cell division protein FtsB
VFCTVCSALLCFALLTSVFGVQSLTSQQLDEARRENTALHAQLVEMQASQQSLQASQVIDQPHSLCKKKDMYC